MKYPHDTFLTSKPKGVMEEFMSPFRGPDIPEEYRDQIIKAEAETPAAKDRDKRILLYAIFCMVTFGLGAANAFHGIYANSSGDSSFPLDPNQWKSNPILNFFLISKIGGVLSLILTGIGGTMIELEQRTKTENAEKIWNELQRRRAKDEVSTSVTSTTSKQKSPSKKNKQNKKLTALAEVLVVQDKKRTDTEEEEVKNVGKDSSSTNKSASSIHMESAKSPLGVLGKIKEFYNQADQLAASQALLLNKELEDRGILEKITDESGLKVVTKKSNPED
jgi:hypothetical protein